MSTPAVVYFSSVSGNTGRFVQRLDTPAARIGLRRTDEHLQVDRPFILITPTYGGGNGEGAVPKQVIKFLNDPANRSLLAGVVSAGNTNFGAAYCLAGHIIARKCQVPRLYDFELFGTPEDAEHVRAGLAGDWLPQAATR